MEYDLRQPQRELRTTRIKAVVLRRRKPQPVAVAMVNEDRTMIGVPVETKDLTRTDAATTINDTVDEAKVENVNNIDHRVGNVN